MVKILGPHLNTSCLRLNGKDKTPASNSVPDYITDRWFSLFALPASSKPDPYSIQLQATMHFISTPIAGMRIFDAQRGEFRCVVRSALHASTWLIRQHAWGLGTIAEYDASSMQHGATATSCYIGNIPFRYLSMAANGA